MNIKNNIINYLCDKDYIITLYDEYFYVFNYKYLNDFNDTMVRVTLKNKKITIKGDNLLIVKMTKEELLIKGIINHIEVENE